jgi:hypothetical protein
LDDDANVDFDDQTPAAFAGAVGRARVGGELLTPFEKGWLYLNLDLGRSTSVSQAFVIAVHKSRGRARSVVRAAAFDDE